MNKKGFVLVETLVVTVFTLFIFTILYNSVVPLLGKYKELSYYDDLDATYDLYHINKLIKDDSNYQTIISSNYKVINCNNDSLNNKNACYYLFDFLEIDNTMDEVIFLNSAYQDELKEDENISNNIKKYLEYVKIDGIILLLQNDGYISYLGIESASDNILKSIKNSTCNPSITDTDGTIYLSGTNSCINFNYVWYSGKLWRITAINPDGTMKMITDSAITSIEWGEKAIVSSTNSTSAYSTSYVREWLNQEFLPTLYNYENIIVTDAGWYSVVDNSSSPIKPTGDYTLTDPVGLLNTYEYYMSHQYAMNSTGGYLNIGYHWHLITISDSSNVYHVYHDSSVPASSSRGSSYGVRPVVNLQSTIKLEGGNGTISNPYRINGDNDQIKVNTTLLNTRSSGEYVKLEGDTTEQLFRIVDTEIVTDSKNNLKKLTTKLVLNDYLKESGSIVEKYFSGSEVLWSDIDKTDSTYWRGYLNTIWLENLNTNMLEKGTYYLGYYDIGSYKKTVCRIVSSDVSIDKCIENGTVVSSISNSDYVGLLRVGEMFANQTRDYTYSTASSNWLITPFNDGGSNMRYVYSYGTINNGSPDANPNAVRPSINLTSSVVIKSGSGMKGDPFVVGLV